MRVRKKPISEEQKAYIRAWRLESMLLGYCCLPRAVTCPNQVTLWHRCDPESNLESECNKERRKRYGRKEK